MDTSGLWAEKHDEHGKSSLEVHTPKVVWTSCKPNEHYFELTGNRECTCNKCGVFQKFVLGLQILQDGKIVNLR